MRQETRNIYKFDELSDDAKNRAIQKWRESCDEIFHQDEILESFKKVYAAAGIKLINYELGLCSYCSVKIDLDDQIGDLCGARALAWLENNLFSDLRITRSEYLKNRKDYFRWRYRIGIVKPCPLTGICYDDDFLEMLTKEVIEGDTLKDVFARRMPEKYSQILQSEYDDQNSDEYIANHLIANEYEFLENGNRI